MDVYCISLSAVCLVYITTRMCTTRMCTTRMYGMYGCTFFLTHITLHFITCTLSRTPHGNGGKGSGALAEAIKTIRVPSRQSLNMAEDLKGQVLTTPKLQEKTAQVCEERKRGLDANSQDAVGNVMVDAAESIGGQWYFYHLMITIFGDVIARREICEIKGEMCEVVAIRRRGFDVPFLESRCTAPAPINFWTSCGTTFHLHAPPIPIVTGGHRITPQSRSWRRFQLLHLCLHHHL